MKFSIAVLTVAFLAHVLRAVDSFSLFSRPKSRDELFLEWFEAAGGVASGVGLQEFPSMGRGVVATTNLSADSVVLSIPTSIILSHATLKSSLDDLHRQLAESIPSDAHCVCAVLLLEKARGEASKFKAYLDVLPTDIPNLSYFSAESLEHLQSPALAAEVLQEQVCVCVCALCVLRLPLLSSTH